MNHLNREQAPFPASLWESIDAAAVAAATPVLTGRRFLDVEGPYGLGLSAIELGSDQDCSEADDCGTGAALSTAVSVPMLRKSCRISSRRLAAHIEKGMPLTLNEVQDAAEAVARREEEYIYFGKGEFNLQGLLNATGHKEVTGAVLSSLESTLSHVIAAITELDNAGFHGPYALTLPPAHYNNLFRHYEHTDLLQIEHLKSLCTHGVFKASINMPAVVDHHAGTIILGQDMRVGYAGSDGLHYHLFVCESMVLRLDAPEAICLLLE